MKASSAPSKKYGNEFHSFIVFYGYLLVAARRAQATHANKQIMPGGD
jgi:hypothetical protein